MIGPHVTDQIPAYALDCLDEQEAIQVEAHLTVCAACRAELEAYKATAAYLGLAAPQVQPPLALKASILRQVKEPQAASALRSPQKIGTSELWIRVYRSLAASVMNSGPILVGVSLLLIIALTASNIVLYRQIQAQRQSSEFHLVAL